MSNKSSAPRGRRVSATDAARNFAEMVNRVRYNDEIFIVEKGGRSVCEIRPVYGDAEFTARDLADLLRSLPAPGGDYLDAVEAGVRAQPTARDTRWRPSKPDSK